MSSKREDGSHKWARALTVSSATVRLHTIPPASINYFITCPLREPGAGHAWACPASRQPAAHAPQPLSHKDKNISANKREKFQALDLEILLGEFRAVALLKVCRGSRR